LSRKGWLAVEAVVVKSTLNVLIPKIKKIGAVDILELGINKVIP
jgi:ATP phosphoribosyltransferase-like protein